MAKLCLIFLIITPYLVLAPAPNKHTFQVVSYDDVEKSLKTIEVSLDEKNSLKMNLLWLTVCSEKKFIDGKEVDEISVRLTHSNGSPFTNAIAFPIHKNDDKNVTLDVSGPKIVYVHFKTSQHIAKVFNTEVPIDLETGKLGEVQFNGTGDVTEMDIWTEVTKKWRSAVRVYAQTFRGFNSVKTEIRVIEKPPQVKEGGKLEGIDKKVHDCMTSGTTNARGLKLYVQLTEGEDSFVKKFGVEIPSSPNKHSFQVVSYDDVEKSLKTVEVSLDEKNSIQMNLLWLTVCSEKKFIDGKEVDEISVRLTHSNGITFGAPIALPIHKNDDKNVTLDLSGPKIVYVHFKTSQHIAKVFNTEVPIDLENGKLGEVQFNATGDVTEMDIWTEVTKKWGSAVRVYAQTFRGFNSVKTEIRVIEKPPQVKEGGKLEGIDKKVHDCMTSGTTNARGLKLYVQLTEGEDSFVKQFGVEIPSCRRHKGKTQG
ncbi:hypothetical protein Ddc_16035 [Ditylenchus destructor]|nr:hypothetical protein Ddc_16035 [Ditylenchus destructor]